MNHRHEPILPTKGPARMMRDDTPPAEVNTAERPQTDAEALKETALLVACSPSPTYELRCKLFRLVLKFDAKPRPWGGV